MTDFNTFWKRWRGPVEGRLANENEGREEAKIQWGKLSEPHRRLAHEWGPHFQKEHRKANGDDCSMLHCCRYLSKKRFLNYEDMEAPEEKKPEPIVFDEDDPFKAGKEQLLRTMGPAVYHNWFTLDKMTLSRESAEVIIASFPNKFMKKRVKETYAKDLASAFQARVRFTVAEKE